MTNNNEKYLTEATFTAFVEGPFKALETKVGNLDSNFRNLDSKVGSQDSKLGNLTSTVSNIALALVKTQEDVKDIKENMATKTDLRDIIIRMDDYLGKFKVTDQELTMQSEQIRKLRNRSLNHGKRIKALES